MKKIILIVMLFSIIIIVNAQEETAKFPYKNSFSLSPFGFANKTLYLNYERGFGNKFGLQLSGGVYYYEKEYANLGYMGELQFRYYFQAKPYKEYTWNRFFFAPYVFDRQYQISDYKYRVYDHNYNNYTEYIKDYYINSYGGGTVIGYNLVVKKFTMEVFLGGGIKLCTTDVTGDAKNEFQDDIISPAYRGIVPKAGFNLGFNF